MTKKIYRRRMENAEAWEREKDGSYGGIGFQISTDNRVVVVSLNSFEASFLSSVLREGIQRVTTDKIRAINDDLLRAGLPQIEVPKWE